MTMVVQIWCRHQGDNVIGADNHLPWQIKSDSERFWNIVYHENVVFGRKTYQSIPDGKMSYPKKIFIFSKKADFEVCDEKHLVISSQIELEKNIAEDEDIYIAGGAQIYNLFMRGKEKFKPHIIVDCVYKGELAVDNSELVDITMTIEDMQKYYRKITPDYCQDNVACALWIRKGQFVEQSVLKKLLHFLEREHIFSSYI